MKYITSGLLVALLGSLVSCGGSSTSSTSSEEAVDLTIDAGTDITTETGDTATLSASVSNASSPVISWVQTSGQSVALSDSSSASVSFVAPEVSDTETLVFEVTVSDGDTLVSDEVSVTVYDELEMSDAFLFFGENVSVYKDGEEVVLEATGRPDHTSCYWNPDNSSGLYVACDSDITDEAQMSPGYIEEYNNLFTLRVPLSPQLADSSSATSLGAVGIAVSGAPIFNDQEGPNVNLDIGVIQGFDRNGAHTGPQTYHYHMEPKAITNDDDALVGIIADGFFLYGRRDYPSGEYPTDLDTSGGHVGLTPHSDGEEVYHYHIKNEFYLGSYYLLFPEDYQGTPNTIN